MALLFAEGFDGWASGSDLANATRSINAGAALGSANTLSNWGDGCLVGSDLSSGMGFGLTGTPLGSLIRTAFWLRTYGSGTAVFSTTVWRPFFNLVGALNSITRWWSLYLLGTQPNVYLSVRKFDDASSPGQAAIGTIPLGDNAWRHVEVEFLIGTSSGTVRTWVDGVADISFTGDTSDAASGDFSVMDHVLLCGSCSNSGNTGTYLDDVIIWDDEGDAFTGRLTDRHRIRTVLPDANGSVNDFTPLSGSNVENVDDVIRDKDGSYTSATAVGEDLFRINTIPFNPAEIYGVYAEALVRREGLLAHTGRIKATRGGMVLTGPTVSVDPTYRAERLELIRDPLTGSRWTRAKLLAGLEAGFERVT
jgi:hypothetical protein